VDHRHYISKLCRRLVAVVSDGRNVASDPPIVLPHGDSSPVLFEFTLGFQTNHKSDTGGESMLSQRTITRTFLMLLLLAGLTGCFGGDKTVKLEASVEAAENVNPDPGGRPSPVVVRVYQLRSLDVFKAADFFAIYDSEVATLGQTFVRRDEFELQPGAKAEYAEEIDPSTRYIGVLAAFRDLDNARWRSSIHLPDEKKIYLRIDLENLAVSVATGER
jgi:type VI secretion system protein VasD